MQMADRREFPACDGLRAVAAGSVFLFHAAALTGTAASSAIGAYLSQLDVGVDVFFVLSGFLLYRPFARAHLQGGEPPAIGRYLKRRFLRIFPAYWLVLIAILYIFHQATAPTAGDGLVFFSLTQIYSTKHALGGLVPAWSLCTEISFYAFLPFYAALLRRWARRTSPVRAELLGIGGLYLGSCVFRVVTSSRGYNLANDWLPSYLDVFALGMLLAVVTVAAERAPGAQWWRALPRDAAIWWMGAAALFVAASNLGMPQGVVSVSAGKYFAHHLLAGTIGVLIVCPAVLHETAGGRIREVLASRPMRSLGFVSYGIFLWHLPWIVQVEKWTNGHPSFGDFWPVLIVGGLLTLMTAWATYVLVEAPMLRPRSDRRTPGIRIAASPASTP